MDSPEATVRAFIDAYYDWNHRSDARSNLVVGDTEQYDRASVIANQEYEQILERFCVSDVVPQALSYGDNSLHDPSNEVIQSVEIEGSAATIWSRDVRQFGPKVAFQYRLVQDGGRWRIASVLYVDEVGADETL